MARKAAIAAAMRGATEVPLETLRYAVEALELAVTVARIGNPSAASDAGVGAKDAARAQQVDRTSGGCIFAGAAQLALCVVKLMTAATVAGFGCRDERGAVVE